MQIMSVANVAISRNESIVNDRRVAQRASGGMRLGERNICRARGINVRTHRFAFFPLLAFQPGIALSTGGIA